MPRTRKQSNEDDTIFACQWIYTTKQLSISEIVEENKKENLLKKSGKWGAIIGGAWIGLNIVIPLALLRIPAVQNYLVALESKLPFDLPGIG